MSTIETFYLKTSHINLLTKNITMTIIWKARAPCCPFPFIFAFRLNLPNYHSPIMTTAWKRKFVSHRVCTKSPRSNRFVSIFVQRANLRKYHLEISCCEKSASNNILRYSRDAVAISSISYPVSAIILSIME